MPLLVSCSTFTSATSICQVLTEDQARLAYLAVHTALVVKAAILPVALESLEGHLAITETRVQGNSEVIKSMNESAPRGFRAFDGSLASRDIDIPSIHHSSPGTDFMDKPPTAEP